MSDRRYLRLGPPPPGALQEQDGAVSMRRCLALYFALSGVPLMGAGAVLDTQWGFWGGVVCCLVALLLMGYTTMEEITRLVRAARKSDQGGGNDQ